MKITIAVAFCIMSALAEPPVDNRYLPPQQGFNAEPSTHNGAPSSGLSRQTSAFFRNRQPYRPRPSNQYGPPQSGQFASQPSAQYLPSRIQTPGSEYGLPKPAQVYGTPGFGAGQQSGAFGRAASRQYLPPGVGSAYSDDGSNGEPANYNFEYMVQDAQSGNDFGHRESRLGDRAEGLYYVLLPDGRKQTVKYEADQGGYKPRISYEDTGLAAYNRNPLGYNAYNTAGGPY